MMKSLAEFDQFADAERSNALLDEFFSQAWRPFRDGTLFAPMDVWETDGRFFVKTAMTGIAPQDVRITVENGVLTLTGESMKEDASEGAKIYRRECSSGRVTRSVRLPSHVNAEGGEAEFEHGYVTVSFPLKEASKPKVIEVKRKS